MISIYGMYFPTSKKIFLPWSAFLWLISISNFGVTFPITSWERTDGQKKFGLHFFLKVIIVSVLWWMDYFIDFTPLYVFVALWQLHFIFPSRLIPSWETKISIKNWRRLFAYFLKVHISSEWCGTYPGGARQWEKALSRRDISSYLKKTLQRVGTCWRIIYKTCWYM